jgi:hypothetical protein
MVALPLIIIGEYISHPSWIRYTLNWQCLVEVHLIRRIMREFETKIRVYKDLDKTAHGVPYERDDTGNDVLRQA